MQHDDDGDFTMPLHDWRRVISGIFHEATYAAAWKGVPSRWKRELEPQGSVKPDGPAKTT
jgi:hypothetical protein